jgi:hypothetical protein
MVSLLIIEILLLTSERQHFPAPYVFPFLWGLVEDETGHIFVEFQESQLLALIE